MDIFLQSIKKGLILFLNYKIILGSATIVSIFFLVSFYIHWPREKESKILKAFFTSIFQALVAAIFIILFFPLFFDQVSLTPLKDSLNILITIVERIVLTAACVWILSVIPFIGKVMMDLAGLQFYFAGLLIFHACMSKSGEIMVQVKGPVLKMPESLAFFLSAVILTTIFYYLMLGLTIFMKGWLRDNLARTVTMIGGIISMVIYTHLYFLHLIS